LPDREQAEERQQAAAQPMRRRPHAWRSSFRTCVEDRRSVWSHTTPDEKDFGRLLDQHAEAVVHACTSGARLAHERRVLAIDHLVGKAAGCKDAIRQRQFDIVEPGRGGVDDEVKMPGRELIEAGGGDGEGTAAGKRRRQLPRLVCGAVGDDQRRRLMCQQRQDHAARRAAGAEQQHLLAGERKAEIAFDVAQQARAVGVVAADGLAVEAQRVDRTGSPGARHEFAGEPEGLFLERYCDIGAAPAGSDEATYAGLKSVKRGEDRFVLHLLPALLREQAVDLRRPAVLNRVAEHGVAIGAAHLCASLIGPATGLRA
jgi:hypothetical protein